VSISDNSKGGSNDDAGEQQSVAHAAMWGEDSEGDGRSDIDADEQQTEVLAAMQDDDDIGKFRRDGVPANSMVERQGDVWRLATDQETTEPWRQLFMARLRQLHKLGLSKDDFLPLPQQKEAFAELRAWCESTPKAQIQHKLICSRYKYKEQINRNWRSNLKSAMFNMFGGQLWVRIVIALGDVDNDMVRIVNNIVAEKIRARESREPTLTPTVKAQVCPRESDTNRTHGVQHRVSEAKRTRTSAKQLQKKVQTEMVAWRQGRCSMTWEAWEQLQGEAEDPCSAVSYVCFTLPVCIRCDAGPHTLQCRTYVSPCIILYMRVVIQCHAMTCCMSRMTSPCVVAWPHLVL
jgi:hypothetical protein